MLSETQRAIFDQYIWPHADTVVRTARLLLRDPSAADDLAQETFVKAIRFIDKFEVGTDARAWVLTILRNTRIDVLRKTNREPRLSIEELNCDPVASDEVSAVPREHSAESLMEAFGDEDVIAALRALPEEIRWTLLLVEVEGLAHEDAATILGVPVGTVKSRTHRGRTMLRAALLPLVS